MRIYRVKFDGKTRFVEASGRRAAINHLVNLELAKLRAEIEAKATEVSAASAIALGQHLRAGGLLEKAGEALPEPAADGTARAEQLFGGSAPEGAGKPGGEDGSD